MSQTQEKEDENRHSEKNPAACRSILSLENTQCMSTTNHLQSKQMIPSIRSFALICYLREEGKSGKIIWKGKGGGGHTISFTSTFGIYSGSRGQELRTLFGPASTPQ